MTCTNRCARALGSVAITVALCLTAASAAFAQTGTWTVNGTNISNPNSGNVGIGTSSPSQKLDVNGNIVSQGNLESKYYANIGTIWYDYLHIAGSNEPGAITVQTYTHTTEGPGYLALALQPVNGNVGIGTTTPSTKLHVAGDVTVDGNIAAKYQDVAEWVPSHESLAAGTVVRASNDAGLVEASRQSYDTAVLGVVSAHPGVVLGEAAANKVLVAQSGRVRVRVDASYGAIHAGDLLVSSPTPGVAMRSQPVSVGGIELHRPGTLLGKALEPLPSGEGDILVLLTLQ